MRQGIVLCELPKAGLGNMLFPLMKAFLFSEINSLPLFVIGYHQIKVGPYLRSEKTKRKYRNYFTFQKSIWGETIDKLRVRKMRNQFHSIEEPPVERLNTSTEGKLFEFGAIPHWTDFFEGIREHRSIAVGLMNRMVRQDIKTRVSKLPCPVIGIHVRMGDYRALKEGEDFSKVGIVRTPEKYFVDVINSIRKIHGSALPVSVFTNGFRNELQELLALPHVKIVEGNRDIEDMILLSKSKIVVTSAGSTFGYWAGFL
jgi:hypothetical protein